MKISEIRNGMRNISVQGVISEKGEERNVMTRYGRRRVADAVIKDDSGEMKLTLWEDQIDNIEEGDKVEITGAYVREFRNNLYLNVPRSGELKKI